MKKKQQFFHMHLVSDATGETIRTVARAATAHYVNHEPVEHVYALVRTENQLNSVIEKIEKQPGIVLFTIVDEKLRINIETKCRENSIPCISILDPVITSLAKYLNAESSPKIGRQHELDADYFNRIDALNFTMLHDDGQHTSDLEDSDIILVGISRTSKTPTSIYLANRGIKVANIPLVPEIPIPEELKTIKSPLAIGLIASTQRISQIRRNRLQAISDTNNTPYTDRMSINAEIAYMKKLCATYNWPIIDVTRRSIEETAAAIMNLYSHRKSGIGY